MEQVTDRLLEGANDGRILREVGRGPRQRSNRADQVDRASHAPGEGSGLPGVHVERVPAPVVRALRHDVLRPGRPASESVYPEDLEPTTVHVAARLAGSVSAGEGTGRAEIVVAVGTALRCAPPWDPDGSAAVWRVRGMATAQEWRGRGFGAAVLDALVSAVRAEGATGVWCNARVPARRLYERAGFSVRGDVIDVPHLGPHLVMWRTVGLCQPIGVVAPGTPGDAR